MKKFSASHVVALILILIQILVCGSGRCQRRPQCGKSLDPTTVRFMPICTLMVIGAVLSVANPYFLVWWASVGLSLALQAMACGVFILALFAIVHWLCDLAWLEFLSLAGFTGSEVFGRRAQTVVSVVCGIVMVGFGAKFLYDAGIGSMPLTVVAGW